jgi:hypothetical protein
MKKPKTFQIAVNGQEKAAVLKPVDTHLYYIEAEDEKSAREKAAYLFRNEYPKAVNVQAKKTMIHNISAIIFLGIAVFLSFIPWHSGVTITNIRPTLISTLSAIFFYSAFIIRFKGIKNSFMSASETVIVVLAILTCASFINVFIGSMSFKIPVNIPVSFIPDFAIDFTLSGELLLFVTILLSWVGTPTVSKIAWIVFIVFAFLRLLALSTAMGIWGVFYILSAFLGIVFMLKNESQYLLNSIGSGIINAAAKTHKKIIHVNGA